MPFANGAFLALFFSGAGRRRSLSGALAIAVCCGLLRHPGFAILPLGLPRTLRPPRLFREAKLQWPGLGRGSSTC